jgi:hypothetical protein
MLRTSLRVPTGRNAWSVFAPPGQDRGDGSRDFVLLITGVASSIPIPVLSLTGRVFQCDRYS